MCAIQLSKECLKCALDGLESVDRSANEDEEERSSPNWHWPQKAMRAHTKIAMSLGCIRSR